MLKITLCPTCGSDKLKKVKSDFVVTSQEETYTVPSLEYYECPNCGEQVYDRQAMQKIEAHSPAFARKRLQKKTA